MMTFLKRLSDKLSLENPDWKMNSVLLLDGAKYHTSVETRENLQKLDLPTMFSAPYSYSSAPIETLFAGLKSCQLNPDREPTGKKALAQLMDMIGNRFCQIPNCTKIRYWHRAVLERSNILVIIDSEFELREYNELKAVQFDQINDCTCLKNLT